MTPQLGASGVTIGSNLKQIGRWPFVFDVCFTLDCKVSSREIVCLGNRRSNCKHVGSISVEKLEQLWASSMRKKTALFIYGMGISNPMTFTLAWTRVKGVKFFWRRSAILNKNRPLFSAFAAIHSTITVPFRLYSQIRPPIAYWLIMVNRFWWTLYSRPICQVLHGFQGLRFIQWAIRGTMPCERGIQAANSIGGAV